MSRCVVQLFMKSDVLTKMQQRADGPRAMQTWRDEVTSSNGYLDGETLKLNPQIASSQIQKLDQCEVIVLQDKQPDSAANSQQGTPLSMCHFLKFGRLWYPDVDAGF